MVLLTGCFPYREIYRSKSHGVVSDLAGAPIAGQPVIACSQSKWHGFEQACERKGMAITDTNGRFTFSEISEWDWCCLGEAPLPMTLYVTCSKDGTFDAAIVRDKTANEIRLVPGKSRDGIQEGLAHDTVSKEAVLRFCF